MEYEQQMGAIVPAINAHAILGMETVAAGIDDISFMTIRDFVEQVRVDSQMAPKLVDCENFWTIVLLVQKAEQMTDLNLFLVAVRLSLPVFCALHAAERVWISCNLFCWYAYLLILFNDDFGCGFSKCPVIIVSLSIFTIAVSTSVALGISLFV
jgi:hypothetical protein